MAEVVVDIPEVVVPEVVVPEVVVPEIIPVEDEVEKGDKQIEMLILQEQDEIKEVLSQFEKSVEAQEYEIGKNLADLNRLMNSILFQEGDVDIIELVNKKKRVLRRQKRLLRAKLAKYNDLVSN